MHRLHLLKFNAPRRACARRWMWAVVIFFTTMNPVLSNELPDKIIVRLLSPDGQPLPPAEVATVKKSEEEWRRVLGPDRFRVLRAQGTEAPLRGLRPAALQLEGEIPFRHRLAEFFPALCR